MNEIPSLETATSGSIRFNTDSSKLEIYDGNAWFEIDATSPEQQTGGTRGLWAGGRSPTYRDRIDFVNINTKGDAIDFGNLTAARIGTGSCASRTRGVIGGGYEPSPALYENTIEFITIPSTGDAVDFGNLTASRAWLSATNDSTRGLWGGSWGSAPATSNIIDYVTIASTGDAVNFGDLTVDRQIEGSCASQTRSIWMGGARGSGPTYERTTTGKIIDFVTTSTLGNAADFGDLITGVFGNGGCSNAIRGLSLGSYFSPRKDIEFITIATLGNSLDFGDLVVEHSYGDAAASPTRAAHGGGYTSPAGIDDIDYVQIMSTGDAVDFGNLTLGRYEPSAFSNGNGGLG